MGIMNSVLPVSVFLIFLKANICPQTATVALECLAH